MSRTNNDSFNPRSVRHQQILDVAANNPDASLREIADEIPSATTDLVDRVLEKYGDPADTNDSETHPDQPAMTDTQPVPDPDDLSPKERQTLQAIHEQPEATQRELADTLDIAPATISNRVNAIDGFEWDNRHEFTQALFTDESTPQPPTETESKDPTETSSPESTSDQPTPNNPPADTSPSPETSNPKTTTDTNAETAATSETPPEQAAVADGATNSDTTQPAESETPEPTSPEQQTPPTDHEEAETLEQLSERLTNIEEQLEALEHHEASDQVVSDPDLAHKILHACLEADTISEEDELEIIRKFIT